MLRPSKHSDPDLTVLAASTTLLRELRKKRAVPFDDLKAALGRSSKSAEFLFLPAVSTLFLLGLVDYRPTTDAFEYLGQ